MKRAIRLIRREIKSTWRMLVEPWMTETRMVADLKKLGIMRGGILLTHSSLSSLGYVRSGASTVIRSLIRAVGPSGTLIMPSHSWELMEQGCRIFDVEQTPSCVGTITEQFRKMAGVKRSLHPTHSVAVLGAAANELISEHELCSTPCGTGSPYEKILESGGQILFLGATLDSNTAFHTIEALAGLPYLMRESPDHFTIIDSQGDRKELAVRRHQSGIERRFKEWERLLVARGVAKIGSVGTARCVLLDGRRFLEVMTDLVRTDPAMLLSVRFVPDAGQRSTPKMESADRPKTVVSIPSSRDHMNARLK